MLSNRLRAAFYHRSGIISEIVSTLLMMTLIQCVLHILVSRFVAEHKYIDIGQHYSTEIFDLLHHTWSLMNCFRVGQGPCRANLQNGVSPNHLPVIMASDRP